ncbi:MAG: hypothetical protein M1818_007794 [Claussenomyces sp. TS43310]|nr:MAG: hypothetical protein M1818_007794 [Claussenomyces sp. TS43310]
MAKKAAAPDAWDDDWENLADQADTNSDDSGATEEVKATKAERLAKHAETNKKIWESAETPETFHFLAAHDTVPLKSEFKPALQVLSRKPAPKVITRQDPVTGLSKLTVEDDDEEGEDLLKNQQTAEERRLQAHREREQKQKKYEEVRARLFGSSDSASGSSSPGRVTPPAGEDSRSSGGRGRGKGPRRENRRPDGQSGSKELFDPNYVPKPGSVTIQRRGNESSSGRSAPREDDQVIRAPRGPDSSGGSGFARRGNKAG